MNVKKIALTCAVILLIAGCIIAAGCTSTEQTATVDTEQTNTVNLEKTTSADLDQVTGAWVSKYTFNGTTYDVIQTITPSGTGLWIMCTDNSISDIYQSTFSNFDGTGNFEKTSSNGVSYKMTYADGTLTETGGNTAETIVYTRPDSIAGVWFNEGPANDINTKFSRTIKSDGTGFLTAVGDDDLIKLSDFTWKKNADGTYTITSGEGVIEKLTMGENEKSLTFAGDGYSFTQEKKYTDSALKVLILILGPWYNEENDYLMTINADGTLSCYQDMKKVGNGTWEEKELGSYAYHINDGISSEGKDISGTDGVLTLKKETNTLVTSDGTSFIRPLKALKNLLFEEITAEPIA